MPVLLLALGAAGSGPPTVIAYVDRVIPAASPATLRIVHDKRPVPINDRPIELSNNDEITILQPDVIVTIRVLADNAVVTLRMTRDGIVASPADGAVAPAGTSVTIRNTEVPGLGAKAGLWFRAMLRLNEIRTAGTLSKGLGDDATVPCNNTTGLSDDPVEFGMPILAADRSYLVAGARSLFVAWTGGVAPFSITLADTATGATIARADGIAACATRLPRVELGPGRYRLRLTDRNRVAVEEDQITVVAARPPLPAELADADIPPAARQIYAATWLSAVDYGRWALEAEQDVAAIGCTTAAAREWLRHWRAACPPPVG